MGRRRRHGMLRNHDVGLSSPRLEARHPLEPKVSTTRRRHGMPRLTVGSLERDKTTMAKVKLERGLHFGVPYTPEMETGGKRPEPTWSSLGQQVREAEALGYDTVLAVETQHDPYLALAIAAQEPSKAELATGIAPAFTKRPV